MRIAVLANLKKDVPLIKEHPPEDDYWDDLDDQKTVSTIVQSLRLLGHKVRYIAPNVNIIRRLLRYKPDLCFNLCEGHFGASREAQIPAILDMLRLPYTGAGVLGMSLSHNKFIAKRIFRWAGLPTADSIIVNDPNDIPNINFKYPVFVKPVHAGTSIGINEKSIVRNENFLFNQIQWAWNKVRAPVLVEQYIEGREFTISVIGEEVLPIIEIVSPTGYYSNEQKRQENSCVYRKCPTDLSKANIQELQQVSLNAMEILNLYDFCRLDVRMNFQGNIFILEVNPLPSLFPDPEEISFVCSAFNAGYSYTEMIERIISEASNRLGLY